jgi:hypothetical protein
LSGTDTHHDDRSFEYIREAVYARFRQCEQALENPDDQVLASVARLELPRYVRYWVGLLAQNEPTAQGQCPACSRRWRPVPVPCDTWKWAHGLLMVTPAQLPVPGSESGKNRGRQGRLAAPDQCWRAGSRAAVAAAMVSKVGCT